MDAEPTECEQRTESALCLYKKKFPGTSSIRRYLIKGRGNPWESFSDLTEGGENRIALFRTGMTGKFYHGICHYSFSEIVDRQQEEFYDRINGRRIKNFDKNGIIQGTFL